MWTDGKTDISTGRTDGLNGQTDKRIDGRAHGWTDRWTYRLDGRRDGVHTYNILYRDSLKGLFSYKTNFDWTL